MVYTLLLRAKTLVSEEDDGKREIQHVKQALKTNNYPDWMLTIPNTESDTRESQESHNEKRVYASVPYIKGISECLQRAFKSHEVTIVHKPVNSRRSLLKFLLRSELGNILLFFKVMFPEQENNIFDCKRTLVIVKILSVFHSLLRDDFH